MHLEVNLNWISVHGGWILTPCVYGYNKVTVRAGTTLKELNHQLELQGLAMNNLPSISEQTVAGAIMTGIVLLV